MRDLLLGWLFLGPCVAVISFNLWRGLRAGEFWVGDDRPLELVRREDKPVGYWATVAVFAVLIITSIGALIGVTLDSLK